LFLFRCYLTGSAKIQIDVIAGVLIMKISARNVLKGTVKSVAPGAVNTEVIIEVSPGLEVASVITKSSAENLDLKVGDIAYAVIKSSDVIVGTD
jgi:molybdopterin-binding protein